MQRNGQNPIRSSKNYVKNGNMFDSSADLQNKNAGSAGKCPKCGTDIPLRPGFRISSLCCPKCGAALGKK